MSEKNTGLSPLAKSLLLLLAITIAAVAVGVAIHLIWGEADKKKYADNGDYSEYIAEASERFDVPESMIRAVIKCESNFDAKAVSKAGAVGLMQMTPATFDWLTGDGHLAEHLDSKKLSDPEVAIRYGTYYLSYLYRKFDYNWTNTLAAYNAGEGNVAKWLKESDNLDSDGKTLRISAIPFGETRNYVPKVLAAEEAYRVGNAG